MSRAVWIAAGVVSLAWIACCVVAGVLLGQAWAASSGLLLNSGCPLCRGVGSSNCSLCRGRS